MVVKKVVQLVALMVTERGDLMVGTLAGLTGERKVVQKVLRMVERSAELKDEKSAELKVEMTGMMRAAWMELKMAEKSDLLDSRLVE